MSNVCPYTQTRFHECRSLLIQWYEIWVLGISPQSSHVYQTPGRIHMDVDWLHPELCETCFQFSSDRTPMVLVIAWKDSSVVSEMTCYLSSEHRPISICVDVSSSRIATPRHIWRIKLRIFLGQFSTGIAFAGIRQICQLTIMIRITNLAKFVCQFIFCIAYLVVVVVYSKPLMAYSLIYLTFCNSQQVWQSLDVKQVFLNLGGLILYLGWSRHPLRLTISGRRIFMFQKALQLTLPSLIYPSFW